jgi:hypothetical protein
MSVLVNYAGRLGNNILQCMALFNRGAPNVYCIDNYSMEKYFKIKQWDGGRFSAFIGKSNFNFYNESKA